MLAGAVACTFLVAVDCMLTHPNYLTYFNALAGGPSNGHKHLVDSSLDWGQDLPALKRWLVAQGLDNQTQTPVYIHYFGTAYPSHFGIHGKDLTREPTLTPGIYCISASNFRRVYTIPTQGRWCIGYEKAYQESLAAMRVWDSADMEGRKRLVATKGEAYWDQTLTMFIHLRLSRLYASLQNREPDDQIGHSILVFRLTAQDLQKATLGPPAEQSAEPVP
jgi:hypothetical protein